MLLGLCAGPRGVAPALDVPNQLSMRSDWPPDPDDDVVDD